MAKTRIKTTTVPPAIAHGNLDEPPECGSLSCDAPHAWQKRAPGDSGAWHLEHVRSRVGAPHAWQNFPALAAPHLWQVIGGRLWLMSLSESIPRCKSGTCNIDRRTGVCR
jgi:hypothetical protein